MAPDHHQRGLFRAAVGRTGAEIESGGLHGCELFVNSGVGGAGAVRVAEGEVELNGN